MALDPRWSQQVATPAAVGTPEARQAVEDPTSGPAQDANRWAQQVQPGGVSWSTLTGQNMEAPSNAFDTTFWERSTAQDEEARAGGLESFGSRWQRPDATGVVMYDDEQRGLKFGDVFLDGRRQGNLREGYAGMDQAQGTEILARLALPREVWAKAYESESGRPLTFAGSVEDELDKVAKANTENYAKGLTAAAFEQGVAERAQGYEESTGAQVANVGAGVAGGAATGAGFGTLIAPGIGTAIGAGLGALLGGVGSWLNRDEQFTALAQAAEQYELATRDGHQAVGLADTFSGWVGYGARQLNPTNNVFRGVYDAANGEVGDAESAWQNTQHGLGALALDTASMVVDGFGTFGGRAARLAYTGLMGATTAGGAASVALGGADGNIAFNPYTGSYEDIGLGGTLQRVGSVGIDAIQTAAGAGVSRVVDRGADAAGGFRIATNEAGEQVTRGLSITSMIPSEAAVGLSARALARRSLRNQGQELSGENLARETARYIDNLTTGRNTIATAVVNGFGEGAEEFVQAVLGATAYGETPTFRELFDSARQGFAMGVGMGTAIGRNATTTSDRYLARANVIRALRGEQTFDGETRHLWDGLTTAQQAQEGTPRDEREAALLDMVVGEMNRQGLALAASNYPEMQRIMNVVKQAVEVQARRSSEYVESSRLQSQSNIDYAPEDYVVSLDAARRDVRARQSLMQQVARQETVVGPNGLPLSYTDEERAQAERIAASDASLMRLLDGARAELDALPEPEQAPQRAAVIERVNAALRSAWHATPETDGDEAYGLRRSASVLAARYPLNSAGSFQLLRLQIDPKLTDQNANSAVLVSDMTIGPQGGDYDGDRNSNVLRSLLPDDSYDQLRWGAGQLTSDGTMLQAQPFVVAASERLHLALRRPGTVEFAAASQFKRDLTARLNRLLEPAGIPVADRRLLVRQAVHGVTSRQPEAISRMMDRLATNWSAEMRTLAQTLDTSPYLRIMRAVEIEAMRFSTGAALREDAPVPEVVAMPKVSQSMPRYTTQQTPASSDLITGLIATSKYDVFRLQTVLKYNAIREATETQPQEREGELAALIQTFNALNQGIVLPGEDAMMQGSAAQQGVIDKLTELARTHSRVFGTATEGESIVLLAGANVQDVDRTTPLRPRSQHQVSFLQALLFDTLQSLRARYSQIINDDPTLSARFSSLEKLTVPNYTAADGSRHAQAGNAFVEVLGATPIFNLLGEQGAAINTYTVRQLRDTLVSMRPDRRQEFEATLRAHPSYAAEREVGEGASPFSPYRVLVDNVIESARQQLSEVDGIPRGELTVTSNVASQNFADMHDSLRKVARARGYVTGDAAAIRSLLAQDAGLASRVLAVIESRGLAAAATQRRASDGSLQAVQFPTWIYDVLAEPSTKRAEMMLLRETLRARHAALAADSMFDADAPEVDRLDVDRVNDRILRLWLHLDYAANDLTDPNMESAREARDDFLRALYDPTGTVDSFIQQLNTDFRFRGETDAAYIPWARDRAVVEASRYGAGVSEVLEGTEMRDALRDAAVASATALRQVESTRAYLSENSLLFSRLREARDNPRSVNRELWHRFEAWIEQVRDLPTLVGASLWIHQASHINEILGSMGTKGMSPTNVAPLGKAIAAQLSVYDAAVGRAIASATSGRLGDVLTDPGTLVRGDRRMVMPDGTVVDWTAITPEDALDLLSDESTAGIAARALGLTAWDYNAETDQSTMVSVLGEGVTGLVADPATALFGGGLSTKLRRLMLLEAKATAAGAPPIVPVLLAQQMNVREAASASEIDPSTGRREQMALEILEDIADSLQALSTVEGLYVDGERGSDARMTVVTDEVTGQETTVLHQVLLNAGREARRQSGAGNLVAGLLPANPALREIGEVLVERWIAEFGRNAVAYGVDHPGPAAEALKTIARRLKSDYDAIDDVASPLDVLLATYQNYTDPSVQRLLLRHAAAHGDITQAVPWAAPELRLALNPDTPRVSVPHLPADAVELPDLTTSQWETVARGVIAFTLHTSYGMATSSDTEISVFPELNPKALADQRSYWDPTFVDPAIDIFAPGVLSNPSADLTPLLTEQVALVRDMGVTLPPTTPEQAQRTVAKLMTPRRTDPDTGQTTGTTGSWNALVPALMHSAVGAVMSSASPQAVSMAGINPDRLALLSATTKADWSRRPADAELSTATVPASQLVSAVQQGDEIDSLLVVQHPGQQTTTNGMLGHLQGRVAREVTVVLSDGTEIPLLTHARFAGGLVPPAAAGVPAGEAGIINLAVLGPAVAEAAGGDANATVRIRMFHPDMKAVSATRGEDAFSHNPWFDGVLGGTDAAFSQDSLFGALFFSLDGTIPAAYNRSLSAIKKLSFALQQVTTMPEGVRSAIVAGGLTDMPRMLNQLTAFVLKQPIDNTELGIDKYNAVRKLFELLYVVRYIDETGQGRVLSAEQMTARQLRGEEFTPENHAEVVGLPLEHLLRLMGELDVADPATTPSGDVGFTIDVSRATQYRNFPQDAWTEGFFDGLVRVDRAEDGTPINWATTSLLSHPRLQNLSVPRPRAWGQSTRSGARRDFFAAFRLHQQEVFADRAKSGPERWATQRRNARAALVNQNVGNQTMQAVQFAGIGDHLSSLQMSSPATVDVTDGYDLNTTWVYVHKGARSKSAVDGVLAHDEDAKVALGDEVVVRASTFLGANVTEPAATIFPEAREALSRLAARGVTFTLPPDPQASELRGMLLRYLRERGYVMVDSTTSTLEPAPRDVRTQTEAAFASRLESPTVRTRKNRVPMFLSDYYPANENALFSVNGGIGALEDYFVREVAQTARYAGYVPAQNFSMGTSIDSARQEVIVRLLDVLRSEAGRRYLVEASGLAEDFSPGTPQGREELAGAERDLTRALDAFEARLRAAAVDGTVQLLPQAGDDFGTGDIVPLVSFTNDGELSAIHLYRHGHEPVRERDIAGAITDENRALPLHGVKLTIDRAKVDARHTTHRGELTEAPRWLGLEGFVVRLRTKLTDLGSKIFETLSGMKWTTAPAPKELAVLTHPVIAGVPILGVGDIASPDAKTADAWLLNTPSRIIETVGFDVTPALVRVLTGTDYTPETATEWAAARNEVLATLRRFAAQNGGSVRAADLVSRSTDGLQQQLMDSLQYELLQQMGPEAPVFQDDALGQRAADLTYLRIVLSALAAGADVDTVLSAPGYLEGAESSHTMHPVFTTLLHQLPMEHPARTAFVEQINNRLRTFSLGPNGYDRLELNPDFTWVQHIRQGRQVRTVPGMLSYPEIRNTAHNDALTEQAMDRKQRGNTSETATAMLYTAWDAPTLSVRPLRAGMRVLEENPFLGTPDGLRSLAFNRGTPESPRTRRTTDDLPLNRAQIEHVFTEALPARRALSVPIDTSGWYEGQNAETRKANARKYSEAFSAALRELRLQPTQSVYLTEMMRTVLARPAGVVDREAGEFMTYTEAMTALRGIRANARRGEYPTHGIGAASVLSRSALQALYQAGYPLRAGNGRNRPVGTDWNRWVEVTLSEVFSADPEVRGYPAVSNIIDGLMYEYRGDVKGLPATINARLQPILSYVQTREGLIVASPQKRQELSNPSVQVGTPRYSARELETQDWMIEELPQEGRAIVERRMAAWEAKNKIGRRRQSPRAEAIRGASVREELARTNVAMDIAQTAYVAKSLANPGLWVSAFLELAQRGGQEAVVSWLSGESLNRREFTPQQKQLWKDTVRRLADSPTFYRMVYENTNFQQAGSQSRLAQRLQRATAFLGALFNDPTWGTRASSVANRFMEAAWSSIQTMQGEQYMSLEQFLDVLSGPNPEQLGNISRDAMSHGFARVEYARGLQDNLAARWVRRQTERVIGSGGPGTNVLGTLLLRFPTMFFRFRSNTIINILGLQAPHAIMTTLLDGRERRPGLMARVRGEDQNADPEVTDTARIEDAYDLTRAIIRSGVSHTQLFLLGSIISSAGFGGGDDDEQKLLNKLRRYQREPLAQDPTALENDFRNAGAWFSNLLPAGMGVPSWILKIFVSPAMGIARWKETGDFRQVWWGFYDAIGDMPLLNVDNILNSWEIAHDLQEMAENEATIGSEEAIGNAQKFLIATVATLENMLFESSFASMVYQGADEWDRDPYKRPLLDSEGTIQREGAYGTPRETDTLQDYINSEGEPAQGYVGRTGFDAQLHSLAENRPVFAWLMSTIMRDQSYLRYNMPVKTREFRSEALSEEEAGALLVSIYNNETGAEEVADDGAEGIVRGIHLGTIRADSPSLQGVFIPNEMRERLQNRFLEEMTQKYLDAGFGKSDALSKAKVEFYGQGYGEPEALGIADILWGDSIPRYQTQQYMQLNTTYVMGPNGRPIATGLQRSVLSAFGLDVVQTYHDGTTGNLPTDQLLNAVDPVRGADLGMRGLTKVDESWYVPTAEEIGEGVERALAEIGDKIDDLGNNGYTPFNYGSGWGRRRGGGGGGGGYSSFRGQSFVPSWGGDDQRLNTPRRIDTPYSDDLYSINTGNPIIRRATIRRERFSSERGRLTQWQ